MEIGTYKNEYVRVVGHQGIFPVVWPLFARTLEEARQIDAFRVLPFGADVGHTHGFKVKPSEVTGVVTV